MGTISSINHISFNRLHELTNNYNKATLLDKLMYWWQISKFKLDDNKIWFTRSIEQIAADSKISKRSVERYLSEFEKTGLIERINKLYKKKNLYIRITDKLLSYLEESHPTKIDGPKTIEGEGDAHKLKESIFLNQHGATDTAKMAESIYKDKYINSFVNNNTVTHAKTETNLKTNPNTAVTSLYPTYAIEEIIGNRLKTREKNYIKGMMSNVQKQNGLSISSPEQVFAEIVFTLLNEEQLQGVQGFNHRIQIIAKLLREKRWYTPKGFYNHADFGTSFRKTLSKKENTPTELLMNSQTNEAAMTVVKLEKSKLALKNTFGELCRLINTDTKQLADSISNLKRQSGSIQLVLSITATLITYYQQQRSMQQEIEVIDELLHNKNPSSEEAATNGLLFNLNLLQHQEQQLKKLINSVFDTYCNMSLVGTNKKEAERIYQQYEALNKLHQDIDKNIRLLEEKLEYRFAA